MFHSISSHIFKKQKQAQRLKQTIDLKGERTNKKQANDLKLAEIGWIFRHKSRA